uniref:40S ribosomal protein S12 n=1 Tax=Steinernema glaseri TaxID=37863 RepID=A0A1I7YRD0_9BILA
MSDGGVLPIDVKEALQKVLKSALIADGLARGLHEACKALDKRQAHFCVLASNCDEPQYVKLVKALCQKHEIPLLEVENKKDLGEWAGLFKMDKEMKARKVVGCSCAVIKDFGREDQARQVIQEFISSQRK